MKKLNYIVMFAAVAAATLVSCQKAAEKEAVVGEEGIKVTLTTNGVTKTFIDGTTPYWLSTDVVGVFTGTNTVNAEFSNTEATGEYAEFEGSVPAAGTYYAYYPYQDKSASADGVEHKIPETQYPSPYSFDGAADILLSESFDIATTGNETVENVSFRRLGGFLKFSFADGTTGSVLNGEHTTQVTVIVDNADAAKRPCPTIRITPEGIGTVGAGMKTIKAMYDPDVYAITADGQATWFGVLPQTFTTGTTFAITISTEHFNVSRTLTLTSDVTLGAGEILPLNVTLKDADVAAKVLTIERLWGKYPNTGWPTDYVGANEDRTMATDGEWIYIAKAGEGVSGIVAISITDPSVKKNVNVTGVDGGHFKTSCVRTIYSTELNKYILLASSLTTEEGHLLKIYAWDNGVDEAPTTLLSWGVGGYRRFGDFFTTIGTWENGELWFRNNTDNTDHKCNLCAQFPIKDGALTVQWPNAFTLGYGGSKGMGSLYFYQKGKADCLLVTDAIGMFFDVNNGPGGKEWSNGSDVSAWSKRFGYTPFEFNGKKYIAYQHMYNAARSWLTILKDTQGTSEGFMQTLIDNSIVFQGAVQIDKDEASTEIVPGATYSANTMANCGVAVMGDHVIIVGHQQNTGLAVFKMYLK